jgi:hypothetical protein
MKNSGGDRRRDAAETTDEEGHDVPRTSCGGAIFTPGSAANQQNALRGIVQN